jgi:glycosyltransferase involved in cell wall biosynthesis
LKILHIVKDFSAPTQTFIYDLISALEAEHSTRNSVAFYRKRFLEKERPFDKVCFIGPRKDLSGRLRHWLVYGNSTEREQSAHLKKIIGQEPPDLIHGHFAWTAWSCLAHYAKREKLDVPVIVSVHGTDILSSLRHSEGARRRLHRFYAENRVHFAATNQFMSEALRQTGIRKEHIHIVPNCVSPSFFKHRKSTYFTGAENFRIIHIGRLVPWKGQRYLIEAFSRFVREVSAHAELTVVGAGALEKELRGLVNELDLSGHVRFAGTRAHPEVAEMLRRHDLYIQPSIHDDATGQCESFGVSILEAICIGLPVIVTNTGGMPEVVGPPNEFAHIVAEKDSHALFQAMKVIYTNRIGLRDNYHYAQERLTRYSQANQVASCLSAYRDLLRTRPPAGSEPAVKRDIHFGNFKYNF